MKIQPDSLKPIYVQIAEGIEDDILNGILKEDEQAYSQNQIAREFGINPATAAKGLNMLVEEGILYKKRGLGMHVSPGAKNAIQQKRKKVIFTELLNELLREAKKLNISKEEIKLMIDNMEGGLEE
ncbi:GntR family transcriptional regulator [Clostridium thermosuccinogenes]|uniref:GntR family transcriptional regulator n=1 Tax=Clostridium thermosuccinogenes TaxID=84032 RepID=A0A2K2FJY4_9CLOT|nr:GntR family transcriptional regulator [Pseudoclostridium thermosuccinogenes]AUS98246.1 GntR family transcriptional regulator [Pseudoclostridium thermosuccinogenes]PNT97194.1 GntR family transcriptional regulator [Pseudoclostridium thermosuccinogenes]PNT99086.1 GntR family transcriptional regulator [Pseudoclostridium thermosuccinogenes]